MIAGHYLIVQRWRPFFLTTENHVRKIAAWIRIPNLPIKLYNHHFLWRVGSTIRHMLKIDRATSIHSRGKFARICVKIDLSKKLVPRISILGSTLNIEYEGLHLIYFSCEKYGYKVEQCSEAGEHKLDQLVVEMAGEEERATAARRRADVSTGEVDRETPANQERIDDHIVQRINKNPPDFGPWMMVRRNQRRKQEEIPRKNKKQIQISNVMPNKETNGSMKNTFNEGGSRFNALYEERDNEMQDNLQPKEAMQSGSKLANSNQALKKNLSHKGLDCPKPINQAPDRALVSTLPRSNRSNIGPLNQTRNQLNKEEGAKVVLRKPGAGRNPQGPQKTAALKIGPMLTKKGFKPKQKMMDKGSLSLWAAIHSMDNAVSSSSKSTDREIMEGVILDRMREKILRRGTPVLTVEDGDGRWAPSEQPGTIKEGNKNSTKGKEPMFHAKASEDMEGSAWRAAPSPSSEAWNCREAGGKGFSTLIRDLRKDLDVNFVILMEIHISGVRGERVRNRFGLNGSFVMEARGQSGGDFNAILRDHERSGGAMLRQGGACPDFNACLFDCGLLDLGYSGCPIPGKEILWLKGLIGVSLILIEVGTFRGTGTHVWKTSSRCYKIGTIMSLKLQRDLWEEYEEIMAQEELLWYQKSCCNWLEFGDRNTKFFHASTMARRRRNRIEALQDDNGNWVHERTTLDRMATSFYSWLYTEDAPDTPFILKNCFPLLDTNDLVGWGLVEKRDSLWVKVLRTKYKCGNDIMPDIRRRTKDSNLWEGVCSAWKDVERNTAWRIGDWDLEKIREWIPEDWVSKIAAMALPSPQKNADQAARDPSTDGTFIVKSAYKALNTDLTENDRVFRFVWDWKGPERIRTFL
ncbi:hypothetical protein Ahy_B06g080712 [Arachis hypogaea]|uniref:Uncharacterized protein n=1 Tax=Arachis hypogaea TaxID=3818 RepID=A0A444YIW0_ARAHY|nr:hypothetical protein Ahy_B06g080712 [Arachis hypogaea]